MPGNDSPISSPRSIPLTSKKGSAQESVKACIWRGFREKPFKSKTWIKTEILPKFALLAVEMTHQGTRKAQSPDTFWIALVLGTRIKARVSTFPTATTTAAVFYLKAKYAPDACFYRFLRRTQKSNSIWEWDSAVDAGMTHYISVHDPFLCPAPSYFLCQQYSWRYRWRS